MFIKLTNSMNGYKGEPIFVNTDNIFGIYSGSVNYTMIIFDTSNFIVKETPEEILRLIKECER